MLKLLEVHLDGDHNQVMDNILVHILLKDQELIHLKVLIHLKDLSHLKVIHLNKDHIQEVIHHILDMARIMEKIKDKIKDMDLIKVVLILQDMGNNLLKNIHLHMVIDVHQNQLMNML